MANSATRDILIKIRQLIECGKLQASDFPLDDVKDSVRLEIKAYESTFLPSQFKEVMNNHEHICSLIDSGEKDLDKIRLFLDGMIMTLSTVSDAVRSLANKDFFLRMHPEASNDPELMEAIEAIDHRGDIRLISYPFMDEYDSLPIETGFDESKGMIYVIHRGRRMYFPRSWGQLRVEDYYKALIGEQDERSPHCYIKDGYEVKPGDVILDVGAAEGFFALNHLEDAEKIYLFEAEDDWIEALCNTFENDGDKIEIVRGYVGNTNGDGNITIDSVLGGQRVNYIKMDIEGYERAALTGARAVLESNPEIACAICAYHCHGDSEWISSYLGELGFETTMSHGYMSPDWSYESRLYAELRRGVVFGKKC